MAGRPALPLPPPAQYKNAAQRILVELGVTSKQLATAAKTNSPNARNWLNGMVPTRERQELIALTWPHVIPELWTAPPEHAELARARKSTGKPRPERALTASARRAQTFMRMRALSGQVREALDALTDAERITAHAGFQAMRRQLLDILARDLSQPLHGQMQLVLPEPDPNGTVARLRKLRVEIQALIDQTRAEVETMIEAGSIMGANSIDGQTKALEKLLASASLTRTPVDKLCHLKVWQVISSAVGKVLQQNREALEVSRDELEQSPEPFARALAAVLRMQGVISFPCTQYQTDILGFFRDILGVVAYDKQAEMLLMVQDNDWSATRSGHRVGKSLNLAGIAWWFYSSFPRARVFITAPTERQLIEVDWVELRARKMLSGVCVQCLEKNKTAPPHLQISAPCEHSALLEGEMSKKPKGGIHSDDLRQITGFSARDAEGTAGLAGANIMFLVEEASGVGRDVMTAIKGNLSGGGKLALFGNPTRTEGEFYDAFHKLKKDPETGKGFYATMTISSWDSPNVKADRVVVPGLATRKWCEDRREEWGEESAQYKIRVLGVHAVEEDGRLFSVHVITTAEERWALDDGSDHSELENGILTIGIDPNGPEGLGDECGFAVVRGFKALKVYARRGLDEDAVLAEALQLIATYGEPGEVPQVNIDGEGVGTAHYARFRQYQATRSSAFNVQSILSHNRAVIEPEKYELVRDELAAFCAKWLRDGGAIPADLKLSAEMHAHELKIKITKRGERLKVTPKDVIRKELKRSPDRFDALCLAVWPQRNTDWNPSGQVSAQRTPREHGGALDPFAGINAAGSDQVFDPYA